MSNESLLQKAANGLKSSEMKWFVQQWGETSFNKHRFLQDYKCYDHPSSSPCDLDPPSSPTISKAHHNGKSSIIMQDEKVEAL